MHDLLTLPPPPLLLPAGGAVYRHMGTQPPSQRHGSLQHGCECRPTYPCQQAALHLVCWGACACCVRMCVNAMRVCVCLCACARVMPAMCVHLMYASRVAGGQRGIGWTGQHELACALEGQ